MHGLCLNFEIYHELMRFYLSIPHGIFTLQTKPSIVTYKLRRARTVFASGTRSGTRSGDQHNGPDSINRNIW